MDMSIRPSGTSAATTAFCAAKIEGDYGRWLWLDGNGKITAGNGTLDNPKPNAFSLVQVADCPFATPVCKETCYVHNLEKFAPETHALYRHNSATIRNILTHEADGAVDEWVERMGAYITANCGGGFRWHVSGDIFSEQYADFIADVCQRSRGVRHWIYTRSFPYVTHLMRASTNNSGNLAINLSLDSNNYSRGMTCARHYNLRACYMTVDGKLPLDLTKGDVIFPDYALRGGTPEGQTWFDTLPTTYKAMVCPVDFHGKSEERRCGRCARCLL
jgi:hypothetical protein